MHQTPLSFSQVESPAPGSVLAPGRHWLRGWVWPRPGGWFVDVRARLGDRVFAGIHGGPRADLAQHFQTGRRPALAEFLVAILVPPGAAEVTLEVLDLEGRWLEFQQVTYTIDPALSPVDFAVPSGPLSRLDFCHGLQLLLRSAARQRLEPLAALAGALADEIPHPRDLRHAPAPLLGFVDEPAALACCRFGRIPAFGHLFHPTLPVRRVFGTVDLQTWQPLEYGLPSPGPAEFYSQYPNARACGFAGLVDVPSQLPNPVCLRLYAELGDGSLHLCQVVRTRLHTNEEEKSPFGPARPGAFEAAVEKWEAALAARHLAVHRSPELDQDVVALRAEYDRQARRRPDLVPPELAVSPDHSTAALPRRVILVTHAFSLQGAPRFLLEYGRFLAAAGVNLHIVTSEDGPMRAEFSALGADITVVDAGSLFAAGSAAGVHLALAGLAGAVDWGAADLVVANTFTTFWAVHAARGAGRPVLLYVHESTTPAVFYERRVHPEIVACAEDAFLFADAVSFTTASTRSYHLGYGRPQRHRLTPGWTDLALLDRWQQQQDRAALRQQFALQPGELLVCNIGTVSDRKGQHNFVRAVDLLCQRYPELAARTRFVLLGGRHGPFDRMLQDVLDGLDRKNLVVHPETTDYLRYYLAADVFACSSYEESSPRVIFEAMACRAPIIASAVQGIPELVRDGFEALLVPAGDTVLWCEGLARMLVTPVIRRDLADCARARVENIFNVNRVRPRHLALAAEVAAGRIE